MQQPRQRHALSTPKEALDIQYPAAVHVPGLPLEVFVALNVHRLQKGKALSPTLTCQVQNVHRLHTGRALSPTLACQVQNVHRLQKGRALSPTLACQVRGVQALGLLRAHSSTKAAEPPCSSALFMHYGERALVMHQGSALLVWCGGVLW